MQFDGIRKEAAGPLAALSRVIPRILSWGANSGKSLRTAGKSLSEGGKLLGKGLYHTGKGLFYGVKPLAKPVWKIGMPVLGGYGLFKLLQRRDSDSVDDLENTSDSDDYNVFD